MYHMLQKCSIYKTLEIFFQYPTKNFSVREISRRINLAHTSVKNNLKKLENSKLIKEKKEKKNTRIFPYYCANYQNKRFTKEKKYYNLKSLEESKLIDYINNQIMPKCIVIFGSFQIGEDIENSDIDVFVESEEEKLDINRFEKKLNRKIQLHFRKSFNNLPKELKNNIINGIVISGFLEVFE